MATVTRYWRTDASGGGDGTTNTTSGGNHAYATLQALISAEATDLVTDTDILHAICTVAGTDTTAVNITGYTTGASNYILIECQGAARHDGDPSTGYKNSRAGNSLTIAEDYVRFKGFHWEITSASFKTNLAFSVGATSDVRFDECLWTSTNATGTGNECANFTFAGNYTLTNCLVIANGHRGMRSDSNVTSFTVDHCGFASGQGYAVLPGANNTITNSWAIHNGGTLNENWYTTPTDPSGSHNASEDTTATVFVNPDDTSNSLNSIVPADEFTSPSNDPASADYTLKSGGNLIGAGTGSESIDITGASRTGSPDIGPFNFAAAGGGVAPLAGRHLQNMMSN